MGGTPQIRIGLDTANYSEWGGDTAHNTTYYSEPGGGTPHKKMCSDVHTGVGTPHRIQRKGGGTPHKIQSRLLGGGLVQ